MLMRFVGAFGAYFTFTNVGVYSHPLAKKLTFTELTPSVLSGVPGAIPSICDDSGMISKDADRSQQICVVDSESVSQPFGDGADR
jgi:hypothetical protein